MADGGLEPSEGLDGESLDQMRFTCVRHRSPEIKSDSLADEAALDSWTRRLRPLVAMPTATKPEPPSECFSYFVFDDGTAALIRRTPAHEEARVVLGSSGLLSPAAAMSLRDSQHWLEPLLPNGKMRRVPPDEIARAESGTRFLDAAQDHAGYLSRILAVMLEHPQRDLAIVRRTHLRPTTVLWTLQEAGRRQLGGDRVWSFSTFEPEGFGRGAAEPRPKLEIAFVPVDAQGPDDGRLRVDPVAQDYQPTRLADARDLVRQVLFGETSPVHSRASSAEDAARSLRSARTTREVLASLDRLEGFTRGDHRPGVRLVLGAQGLEETVHTLENRVRQELVARVRDAVFGPGGSDLLVDAHAEEMAAEMVGKSHSDTFAVAVIEAAERLGRVSLPLSQALVERTTNSRAPFRAPVPTRWRALVVLLVMVGLLAMTGAFLLGGHLLPR